MVLADLRTHMRPAAVSFDLGQTLLELDETLLLAQARQRGFWLAQDQVLQQQDLAWQAYNVAKAKGKTGFDAWSAFIRDVLVRSEFRSLEPEVPVDAERREDFVRYLWSEQPHNNLWRRPVDGMLELVGRLAGHGTRIGVLTNSEGRAKELLEATGFGAFVDVVLDSSVEGLEKPDPRIFARMAERLGCTAPNIVHVGDSYEADVLGALGAGMTPIWFVHEPTVTLPPGVLWCRNASELGTLLCAE
jgi:FMN phosphatase YigB (HAD superfamily)